MQATDPVTGAQVQLLMGIAASLGLVLIGVAGFFIKEFVASVARLHDGLDLLTKEMHVGMGNLVREFGEYKLHVAEAYVPRREFRRLEDRLYSLENTDGDGSKTFTQPKRYTIDDSGSHNEAK